MARVAYVAHFAYNYRKETILLPKQARVKMLRLGDSLEKML
jgi:hypothetical protein